MYLMPSRIIEIPCPAEYDSAKLLLGVFITAGTVISYVPQVIKFIQKKTSEGLSLYFFFLGAIGMTSLVANVFLLSFPSIICCIRSPQWGPLLCTENTFGLTQVATQTFCFLLCVALYYVYYPQHQKTTAAYTRARWVGATIVVFCAILFFTTLGVLLYTTDSTGRSKSGTWIAGALGLLATVTSVLQFLPQLLHTWSIKAVGALSIPMMLMQTPGGFLMAYSLYIQPSANWTSWLPYLICGSLQGLLLIMCIVFTLRPSSPPDYEELAAEAAEEERGEAEPLLGGGGGGEADAAGVREVVVEDEAYSPRVGK
ncbi:hypothetical protein BDZ88DRAFT_411737 [Geranomyces variabilis]|nr:hypothetical protein BDZ88DRAFT_411737 [Geranomyces variabilis]KAJ3133886.1 hypothetical protein HDU90_005494 [Geranomyces variabilis]